MRIIDPYLRTLRKLDREWQATRAKLDRVRSLVDSLPPDRPDLSDTADLSELEAEEAAARAAFDAHAAQEPALSQEYIDRAELAQTTMDARRAEHALGLLLTAPRAGLDTSTRLAGAIAAVKSIEHARAALVAEANTVDAEYQAALANGDGGSWYALGRLESQATKLRERIASAEGRLAKAQARERDARERHEAREAADRRHVAEIALARAELARIRAYADELRAKLPATVSAPLREPRRGYGLPAPAELHGLIRERYRWEPATETLQ